MNDTPTQPDRKRNILSLFTEGYVIAATGAISGIVVHQFRTGYFGYFGFDRSEISFAIDQTLVWGVMLIPVILTATFMIAVFAFDERYKKYVGALLLFIGILLAYNGTTHLLGALLSCLTCAFFLWCAFRDLKNSTSQSEATQSALLALFQAYLFTVFFASSVGAISGSLQSKFPTTEFNNKPHLLMIVDSSSWYLVPFDEKKKTFSSSHLLIEKSELKSPIEIKKVGPLTRAPENDQAADKSPGEKTE